MFRSFQSTKVKTRIQIQHHQARSLAQQPPQRPATIPRPTKMPLDGRTLLLPDGRTLGYAEYGSPNGTPLLYFHGFPASRIEASFVEKIASRRNIRLLALDRPGFGLSTHDPKRRITDWPADVQAFAAHVGISRFPVLGVSGGGPYALACAKLLPREMLSGAGVLAGAAPWDNGVRTQGVPWYARLLYLGAKYWPAGTRLLSSVLVGTVRWIMETGPVQRKIDAVMEAAAKAKVAKEKKDDDANVPLTTTAEGVKQQESEPWTTAQRRERVMGLLFEGFAQGTAGFVLEARLLSSDWGFKFEDVTYDKVQIWHGSKDANAPVRGIRDMAARMPHCVLKEYDENHFGMGNYYEEVFEALIPSEATTTSTSTTTGNT